MKKFFKILLYVLLGLLTLVILVILGTEISFMRSHSQAEDQLSEKQVLTVDGMQFRDLNGNGALDVYEDRRQEVEARIEDLLSQMNTAEKAGLMWHPPIGVGADGELVKSALGGGPGAMFGSNANLVVNQQIKHFNLFTVPDAVSHARWYNALQQMAEQDRLGIPVTISSDPRHGINNFIGSEMLNSDFSLWPEPIGLAAIGDSAFMVEFGRIANAEYNAVGIRTALHPMADLATEPRWARINGTFGEDAALSAKMTAAYIYGFQGDSLNPNSVACMTKHWPGGGPQEDGEDAHFAYGANQIYPGGQFRYHIRPFEAAFEAGTAMIMPYYGVPVGQTSEEVGMSFNREIITEMLREEYGYEGIVCSDWSIIEGLNLAGIDIIPAKNYGVEQLSIKERIQKAIDAGVDQFGGNANTEELIELIEEGSIAESRIDESVRRLLRAKFVMGLFDDPYVDESAVKSIVGKQEFVEKGKLAQRRSLVLLKNEMKADSSFVLPLAEGLKIYSENMAAEVVAEYGTPVDSLAEADIAILHLQTPWEPRTGDMIERMFHQGTLEFDPVERDRILGIMDQKPTIVCIYMDRPAVMPEIAEKAKGILVEFGAHDDAMLDVLFGKFAPEGKLPFEIPSSMEAVQNQKEDVPYDSESPLFPFGHGLSYPEVAR
jgi:beta-glucosidase